MPFTQCFIRWSEFAEHYGVHVLDQREFGPVDPRTYLLMADAFVGGPCDYAVVLECVRSRGDVLRYNRVTQEFGIRDKNGVIRTYFRPGVGRPHRFATNEDYFWDQCKQY